MFLKHIYVKVQQRDNPLAPLVYNPLLMDAHKATNAKLDEKIDVLIKELLSLGSITKDFLSQNPVLDNEDQERFFTLGKLMLHRSYMILVSVLKAIGQNYRKEEYRCAALIKAAIANEDEQLQERGHYFIDILHELKSVLCNESSQNS